MGLFGFGKPKKEKIKITERMIVMEGYKLDFGHMTARIDWDSMDEINVNHGDKIMIDFDHQMKLFDDNMLEELVIVTCAPLYPSDEGKRIIRINQRIRNMLQLEIGDIVSIRRY